jgi:predicted nucleic acid-binding Zn ribbon protein
VYHPAGIVFKGSGFYATDSRSGSKPAAKPKKDDGGGGGSTTPVTTTGSESSVKTPSPKESSSS